MLRSFFLNLLLVPHRDCHLLLIGNVQSIEDEEEVFESPEQQSSKAAAELEEMVQTQEEDSCAVVTQSIPSCGERPVPKFIPIPVTNSARQEDMEWDVIKPVHTTQTTRGLQERRTGRRSSIRLSFPPSPRHQERYIPAGLEKDEREERKREQEARAGTGRRKRPYNPNRHLHKDDFVFASDIQDRREEKSKQQGKLRAPEQKHRHLSLPRSSEARAEGQDLRHWLKGRQSARSQNNIATIPRGNDVAAENKGNPTGGFEEVRPQTMDPAFDYHGFRLRGAQFGELNRIPQDPRIDPPPRKCFRCWEGNHSQRRCPRREDIPDNFCYNCGRQGRSMVTCERCCEAHTRHLKQAALKSSNLTSARILRSATITSQNSKQPQEQASSNRSSGYSLVRSRHEEQGASGRAPGHLDINFQPSYAHSTSLTVTARAVPRSQALVVSAPYYQPTASTWSSGPGTVPPNVSWSANNYQWGLAVPQWNPYAQVPQYPSTNRMSLQPLSVSTVETSPLGSPNVGPLQSPLMAVSPTQPPLPLEAPPQLPPPPAIPQEAVQSARRNSHPSSGQDPVALVMSQASKPGVPAELRDTLYRYVEQLAKERLNK